MLTLCWGERYGEACALLLGGFDGLHLGHATLVSAAKELSLPVGLTSMSGGKTGGDVFAFEERETIYEEAGLQFNVRILLDAAFRAMSAEDFLKGIFSALNVKAVFCGADFRFGKNASGDVDFLRACAPCPVYALPILKAQGEKVASTSIKNLLSAGDMSAVNGLLYRPYFIGGTVEHGRGVGRTVGFPTANLTFPAHKFPLREGVYGGRAATKFGEYPAIINVGARPTFGVGEKKVEAYLIGFNGDLYDSPIRIYPKEFYRGISAFESVDKLTEQLRRDTERLKATDYGRSV